MFDNPKFRYLDKLSVLESHDLVRKAFSTIHDLELSAEKANEILAYLSQARSYKEAASNSEELVKPLLQYYSNLALSRAVILLQSPVLRDASLNNSHGLNLVGWKEHFGSGGDLLNANVRVTQGSFSQFADITKNRKVIEIMENDGSYEQLNIDGTQSYPDRFEFRVEEVFQRIPNAIDTYEAIFHKPGNCWSCMFHEHNKIVQFESTKLGIPSVEEFVDLLFLENAEKLVEGSQNYMGLGKVEIMELCLDSFEPDALLPHVRNISTFHGAPHLVRPFENGVVMSSSSILLACSYILGMFARYFPLQWIGMLTHKKGDSVLPVVRKAFDASASFETEAIQLL